MASRVLPACALVLMLPTLAIAEEVKPDAATLLFDENQLSTTRPGDVLTYAFSRKTTPEAQLGPSFDDRIRLVVDHGRSDTTRTIEAQLFSGARRRPAGPFDDMTGNPLLSLVLEENIEILATRFGANPRYFKTAIRAALRDKASVVADSINVGGKPQPGWRVTIAPFRDDPNKARMFGLDTLTYEFKVAKAVPGEIAAIHISAPRNDSNPLIEETVDYVTNAD